MKRMPLLKSVMTPFPYSVDVDAPVDRARQLMYEHGVRHLAVTEGAELVGVVSERDLLRLGVTDADTQGVKVRDIAKGDLYVVDLNERIDTVLLTMAERHIGSVMVTRKGKLAGVFTMADACRTFGDYLRKQFPLDEGGDVA